MTDNDKKILQDTITATHQALQVATMNLVSARYILHHATLDLKAVTALANEELKIALAEFSDKVAQVNASVDALRVLESKILQIRQSVAGMTPGKTS